MSAPPGTCRRFFKSGSLQAAPRVLLDFFCRSSYIEASEPLARAGFDPPSLRTLPACSFLHVSVNATWPLCVNDWPRRWPVVSMSSGRVLARSRWPNHLEPATRAGRGQHGDRSRFEFARCLNRDRQFLSVLLSRDGPGRRTDRPLGRSLPSPGPALRPPGPSAANVSAKHHLADGAVSRPFSSSAWSSS